MTLSDDRGLVPQCPSALKDKYRGGENGERVRTRVRTRVRVRTG